MTAISAAGSRRSAGRCTSTPCPASWPRPDAASFAALAGVVDRIPDGAVVLVDGLIASTAPEVLVPQARRLRLVVLVHMPLGHRPRMTGPTMRRARERAVLSAATAVVTTSAWTRRRLLELYPLPADRVHVAEPGVDAADLATGTAGRRGAALRRGGDLRQGPRRAARCARDDLGPVAGSAYAWAAWTATRRSSTALRRRSLDGGLDDRVRFPGPRTGADLDRSYAAADLLVLASRAETYGMVVTEALARGLPSSQPTSAG